jgi:hypothetical protein
MDWSNGVCCYPSAAKRRKCICDIKWHYLVNDNGFSEMVKPQNVKRVNDVTIDF